MTARILAAAFIAAILFTTVYVVVMTAIELHALDVVLTEVQTHHNR